jgi:hypothetical protein
MVTTRTLTAGLKVTLELERKVMLERELMMMKEVEQGLLETGWMDWQDECDQGGGGDDDDLLS